VFRKLERLAKAIFKGRSAMAAVPPICEFGLKASAFELPATDGRRYSLDELKGPKGTVVVFICNHCPYVKAVIDRLIRDARDLEEIGVSTVAICSNDARAYPQDSFESMRRWALEKGFPFKYLHDESQEVARAYGAVCTPDFFGYDAGLGLQYRGRLDDSKREAAPGARRELYEAMKQVAETGRGPEQQIPSMGCSIKWKTAA
jgi:peroxiredoxin